MRRLLSTAAALIAPVAALAAPEAGSAPVSVPRIEHVVLVSVDGLHALDLERFIVSHPESTLAHLARHGVRYSNASTSRPSDSFPGILSIVTGGSPASTGVFYDVSWDRTQFAPGNAACSGTPGNQSTFDETIDKLQLVNGMAIDLNRIDPSTLPYGMKDGSCQHIYPHDFVRVNTIFEVIRGHGGRTAWADKHAAYDLVNGPSGKGVQDLYTPEITNPLTLTDGQGNTINGPYEGDLAVVNGVPTPDATVSVLCTIDNDLRKVKAVVAEIEGYDHTGRVRVGTPTITGLNFQAVSVGQKVSHNNTDGSCNAPDPAGLNGQPGGYLDGSGTPTAVLTYALEQTDAALGQFVAALAVRHLTDRTLVVITAKHGQAPVDPRKTAKVGHFQALPALAAAAGSGDPIAQAIVNAGENDDDIAMLWFQEQDKAAIADLPQKAAQWIRDHADPVALPFEDLLAGEKLVLAYDDPATDARTPDIIVVPPLGMIYTGSGKKNAEHGGLSIDDTNVALLVANPALAETQIKAPVQTTQIAPTILRALEIDPAALDAVRIEHTGTLPGLSF